NVISQEVVDVHQRDLSVMQSQGGAGVFDFEAWKRRVSKIDDSWKH
ncbi:MAG TPA: class II aldolase, partial [Erythrobacter sp.]|nr:class II aldolase [Erythrobacter sp.]